MIKLYSALIGLTLVAEAGLCWLMSSKAANLLLLTGILILMTPIGLHLLGRVIPYPSAEDEAGRITK
jgi:multisubunit Na+/H+ antiporter MnhG subunit